MKLNGSGTSWCAEGSAFSEGLGTTVMVVVERVCPDEDSVQSAQLNNSSSGDMLFFFFFLAMELKGKWVKEIRDERCGINDWR